MKTKYYFLFVLFLATIIHSSYSQDYHPLPTNNAYWSVYQWDDFICAYDDRIYTVEGDTIINGLDYTKVYQLNDEPTIYDTIKKLHCFMRQDNDAKKIWFIRHYLNETTEKLGYDLSVNVGDTVSLPAFVYGDNDSLFILLAKHTYVVPLPNGQLRNIYTYSSILLKFPMQFIEGLTGFDNTFPYRSEPWDAFHQSHTACMHENNIFMWPSYFTDTSRCGFNVLSIKDVAANILKLHPNPANNYCIIEPPKDVANMELSVFDLLGKTVFTLTNINKNLINLDVSRYSAGIYTLKLRTPHRIYVNKLIIQH